MNKKALLLAGALALTWCDYEPKTENVDSNIKTTCGNLQNVMDTTTKNWVKYRHMNWEWILRPFIRVCTTNWQENSEIRWKIRYWISQNFQGTGKQLNNTKTEKEAIENFASNLKPTYVEKIGNVRPWIKEEHKPSIRIWEWSYVKWYASPEWDISKETWKDILDWNTAKNIDVAKVRAQNAKSQILSILKWQWIKIIWENNFKIWETEILKFEGLDTEVWALIKAMYDNNIFNQEVDPLENVISIVQNGQMEDKNLQNKILKMLSDKRFSEIYIKLEWSAIHTEVKNSPINIGIYAFITVLFSILLIWLSERKKRKRKNK